MKIMVGYWNSKTGAFYKEITESQQKQIEEGTIKPLYTRPMTDDEIIDAYRELIRNAK